MDKVPLQGMLNTMVDNFSTLFTHVTSSTSISAMIGCLAQPIGELYHEVAKRTSVKVYNNSFQQKVGVLHKRYEFMAAALLLIKVVT